MKIKLEATYKLTHIQEIKNRGFTSSTLATVATVLYCRILPKIIPKPFVNCMSVVRKNKVNLK